MICWAGDHRIMDTCYYGTMLKKHRPAIVILSGEEMLAFSRSRNPKGKRQRRLDLAENRIMP